MAAFYIAPEASIPYTIVSPTGARAVLNDESDPDFVGYLDGDEAISGIDSPEIRDTYADLVEAEGGLGGTNFYSRRPIVMNGIVIPTSASDRNTKLGKLMAATDARSADGTLSWTPTGGEPVFLKFRRQLPFRATGGFNKKFQIGLVANDPRIYTVRTTIVYTETNGNSNSRDYRRFTWASGTNASVVARSLYLPPGTYTMKLRVKCSQVGRVLAMWNGDTLVSNVTATANGGWQTIERTFTKASAEGTADAMSVYLDTALTAGNYLEVGDLVVESAAGLTPSNTATFATNWSVQAGYTASFQTASPPDYPDFNVNGGSAVARPIQRIIGPFDVGSPAANSLNYVSFNMAAALGVSDYLVIDYANRTVIKNNTTNQFADVLTSSTWGGMLPDSNGSTPLFYNTSGATTATRMETYYRWTFI